MINIKGQDYQLKIKKENNEPMLRNADGVCSFYTKEIVIEQDMKYDDSKETKEAYERQVVKHEIVHAFLFESGLTNYATNELLVEWVAQNIDSLYNKSKEGIEIYEKLRKGIKR